MPKSPFIAAVAALALSAAPTPIPFGSAPAQALTYLGSDANGCISLNDNSLYNSCSFTVWVTWCVENVDCRSGGKFSNLEDIGAGGSYPVYGASTGNYIHWGVCRAPEMPIDRGNYSFECKQ